MKILRCLGFLLNFLSKGFIHDVLGDVILGTFFTISII